MYIYNKNGGLTFQIGEEHILKELKVKEMPFFSVLAKDLVEDRTLRKGIVAQIEDGMIFVDFWGIVKQFQYT